MLLFMLIDVNFTPPPVFPRPFPVFLNYASPNSHPKYTPLEVLIQYDLRCQMTTRLRLTVFVNIISVFFHNSHATSVSSDLQGFQP